MINTLYSLDALGTPVALFLALALGIGFGFALERAGFSSSRRLAGLFYFKDMAVVKVMFSAMVTAMLGLSYLVALEWVKLDGIFLMPTIYGAQIVGGLLFGVGFAMGAWCPGTAVAGLAAGRVDALVFLVGGIVGSILFNEVYPMILPLYTAGDQGVRMVYDSLGVSRNAFVLGLTAVAVVAFWLCEWVERARTGRSAYLGSPFLAAFSVILLVAALGLRVLPAHAASPVAVAGDSTGASGTEQALMAEVAAAADHVEPEALADRLMAGEAGLVVVDVRPADEYAAFHIRGAVNVTMERLAQELEPYKNRGAIVLYSNGMTHPAQARDSLQRQGFANVYILTDGIVGFRERCLKPASLRAEPLAPAEAARVNAWRAFFAVPNVPLPTPPPAAPEAARVSKLVETEWLAEKLGTPGVKVIDLRPQPEYNGGHIPGSLSLNVESLRGNVGGVPSMLLPAPMLAAQFALLGLTPRDVIVWVAGEKFHDATLASMACERLGHVNCAVLNGGFAAWAEQGRPLDMVLPVVTASDYPAREDADSFTVDARAVAAAVGRAGTSIVDVRPADAFTGAKREEARGGHIPGAWNRPYTSDVMVSSNKVTVFRGTDELAAAYGKALPDKDAEVIVHCRTGHQASQTYFVLRHLLGYRNVRWYDAGWTEWAAKPELPVEEGAGSPR